MKLALIALLLAPSAPSAAPPCLTRAQLESLAMFGLPPVLDAMATKCRPSLPSGAYLLNGGRTLSQSLAADSLASWGEASSAMEAITGRPAPPGLSGQTMQALVRDMAANEIKLKPEECVKIDRLGELLAPLPPRNLAGVVAMLAEVGIMNDKKNGKPRATLCPAS